MSMAPAPSPTTGLEVAIIGMAGHFPGAKSVDQFWSNLCDGVESVSHFSDQELQDAGIDSTLIHDPNSIKASSVLEDIELFDAAFFGFTPREARITDPQHRIFLECAWEALEQAGYTTEQYSSMIGVYAGVGVNFYLTNNLLMDYTFTGSADDYQKLIANDREFFSTRVSYKLNLTGPSFTVQSACSTSLVAVHLACQGLISGECDMALAGGASIRVPQKTAYIYQEGSIIAPDGHCRPFDAKAQGIVVGSGAAVVVLKRLADALADGDSIYAVIKGSAISNDGGIKAGYTAPSVEGQARVIRAAQRVAEVEPETISYVEAHGTATALGDPIEVAALTQAFRVRTQRKQFCAIGSLKSNVGHLDTAAGVASVIKTALALKHRQIPPSLHFEQPNPQIDFANSPFYVNTTLADWPAGDTPRRAGVSAFGFGGTNAHIVLEEAPPSAPADPSRPWHLLVLSAKTRTALDTATANLVSYLRQHPEANLADVAHTLQVGRKAFEFRRALACRSHEDALAALEPPNPQRVFSAQAAPRQPPIIFMFPGAGSQYPHMASELYQAEPVFRAQIDRCAELLRPHLGRDLREVLYPDNGPTTNDQPPTANSAGGGAAHPSFGPRWEMDQMWLVQPVLFTIEYALTHMWMAWGVQPQALIGHSLGEYVAACLAGVLSLEEALMLVAVRARLMQSMPTGSMLSVPLPEAEIRPLLGADLDIAAVNGAALCVVAGPTDAVNHLEQKLAQQGIESRPVPTSHAAHSAMLDPILETFAAQVAQVHLNPPSMPYISCITGTWITPEQATDPRYWAQHLRQTVRFADGIQELLAQPGAVLLEVGPGTTLSTFAKRHPRKAEGHAILSSLPRAQDQQSAMESFLTAAGRLWLAGVPLDWAAAHIHERRQRIPLPTYPFERQRHWMEAKARLDARSQLAEHAFEEPLQASEDATAANLPEGYAAPRSAIERSLAAVWQRLLGIERIGIHDNFFELGGDSLLAVQVVASLRQATQADLSSHSLLQAPTIAMLAELVGQDASAQATSQPADQRGDRLLVPLQPAGKLRPLFLIHPVGGGVYIYRDLAQQLGGDRPVYAIQAQGLNGEAEPIPQVEQMAARYVAIIRAVQPEGPYLLGGSSFGGIVAFEMAQQLQALGQRVGLLALIDSPDVVESAPKLTDDLIAASSALGASANMAELLAQVQELTPDEQLRFFLEQAHAIERSATERGDSDFRRLFQLLLVHHRAMRSYRPRAYAGGEIIYFRASEHDALYPPNAEHGWIPLAPEGIAIHEIPGNHISMNQLPHVQIMASKLRRYLNRTTG